MQEGRSERCAGVVAVAPDIRVRDHDMDERLPRAGCPWGRRQDEEPTCAGSGVQLNLA